MSERFRFLFLKKKESIFQIYLTYDDVNFWARKIYITIKFAKIRGYFFRGIIGRKIYKGKVLFNAINSDQTMFTVGASISRWMKSGEIERIYPHTRRGILDDIDHPDDQILRFNITWPEDGFTGEGNRRKRCLHFLEDHSWYLYMRERARLHFFEIIVVIEIDTFSGRMECAFLKSSQFLSIGHFDVIVFRILGLYQIKLLWNSYLRNSTAWYYFWKIRNLNTFKLSDISKIWHSKFE